MARCAEVWRCGAVRRKLRMLMLFDRAAGSSLIRSKRKFTDKFIPAFFRRQRRGETARHRETVRVDEPED